MAQAVCREFLGLERGGYCSAATTPGRDFCDKHARERDRFARQQGGGH